MRHKKYALRWSRTTPFTAIGKQGVWKVGWRRDEKLYLVTLDGRARGDTDTVNEGKQMAEHLDADRQPCHHCSGKGWM